MSSTPTRNFSLTAELDCYIRQKVTSGRYSSASEVIRAGLRLLAERDQALPLTQHELRVLASDR